MSFQANSGQQTINGNVSTTITGNLPHPSATQTLISKTLGGNGAWRTIHTTTAGKTFYLTGVCDWGANGGSIGTNGDVAVCSIGTTATLNYAAYTPASPIAKYAAGENVRMNFPASDIVTITGYEE